MDRIVIRDLLVRGILGINPEERRSRQDILVNIELLADTRKAAASDDIADAVNYRSITKRVIAHIEKTEAFLVERLVNELAGIILAEFPVAQVTVRIEKPGALRFSRSVGIEVTRSRSGSAASTDDG